MSEIAETQSRSIPKRDDFLGTGFHDKSFIDKGLAEKDLAEKDSADKQAFAQVEKWMATIRELSYEQPRETTLRG
jgi:hypothetical protein